MFLIISTQDDFSVFEMTPTRSPKLIQKDPVLGIQRLEIIKPDGRIMMIAAGLNMTTLIFE